MEQACIYSVSENCTPKITMIALEFVWKTTKLNLANGLYMKKLVGVILLKLGKLIQATHRDTFILFDR